MTKPYLNTLYTLCGFPFTGKSTLARELESWLGIKRVSIDEINGERGIWNDETGMSAEEWERTYQEAYRRIATHLSQDVDVIDESANFTREQRDRLRDIAEQHHAQASVIFIDIPLSEARRRWQANRQIRARADVRDEDFAHVVDNFAPPTEDEHVLHYDGSLPPAEWVRHTFPKEKGLES
ncbi:AAA family ATPase [Ktedonobacter racemifer]|uniref:Kinase n=1 Tax=Ktedonobacter racemifer DSM 44963 TaxID=485913 RepID=D6TVT4_KTERA|nr:ATP-binding protein [Ktedonobacter racemifer]EFH84317.1 hypothetical protein Krac_5345 [Ktedonobacter racemifer DSM 44963]